MSTIDQGFEREHQVKKNAAMKGGMAGRKARSTAAANTLGRKGFYRSGCGG
jgi:hypothetical protein